MKYILSISLLTLLLSFFFACDKQDDEALLEKEDDALYKYITDNKLSPDTIADGVYYIHGKTGIGPKIVSGSKVSVFYIGTLLDGDVFKDNIGDEEPFVFTIGKGEVIKGWEKGMLGMHEGDTGTLILHSSMAYGKIKNGPIPPFSTVVFDVEIYKVE